METEMVIKILIAIVLAGIILMYFCRPKPDPHNHDDEEHVERIVINQAKNIIDYKFKGFLEGAKITSSEAKIHGSGYKVKFKFNVSGNSELPEIKFAELYIADFEHHYERKLLCHNIESFE